MDQGWRKVILAALFGAGVLAVPSITPTQAEVLEFLIVSVFAANGVEHVAKGASSAVSNWRRAGTTSLARSITVQEKSAGDSDAH